jgi:4-hydroxy-4-methyl-2-oxoglutarate aldolase
VDNQQMIETLKGLLEAGTAVVSDVFDSLGLRPPVLDTSLFSVKGPGYGFAGPAYTVVGESREWAQGGDREKLAAIDAMTPGVVPVWAGTDIRGVCCFGDLLASSMQARGCAGVVVDGGVRDTAYLRTLSMPVMARFRTPAQGVHRWKVTAAQVPVQVRGAIDDWVTVEPGDNIIADDDGVIVVPQELLQDVSRRVAEWSSTESAARQDILQGTRLLEALEKYGHL